MVCVLGTLNHDRMLDARGEDKLDDLVATVRKAMAETMNEGPA